MEVSLKLLCYNDYLSWAYVSRIINVLRQLVLLFFLFEAPYYRFPNIIF